MELRIDGTHFVWNNGDTEPRRDGVTDLGIDGDTEIRTMTQEERWVA